MKPRLSPLTLLSILLVSGWLVMQAAAQEPVVPGEASTSAQGTGSTPQTPAPVEALQPDVPRFPLPAGGGGGIASLAGSYVAFDSFIGGDDYYVPGTAQTFCFRAESFTDDWEYVHHVNMRFPEDVTVTNAYVAGTPSCIGTGTFGTFSWSFLTEPYEVDLYHPRYHAYSDHCTAYYCFDVTSGAGSYAPVSWYWDGDGFNASPHHPCSNDAYTPLGQEACDDASAAQAVIPPSTPGIILTPASQEEGSCAGEWQEYTLAAFNFSGENTSFDLSYSESGPSKDEGPPTTGIIPNGGSRTFPVRVKLSGCMLPGPTSTTSVFAQDPLSGLHATATIKLRSKAWLFDALGWQSMPVTGTVPTYWQTCAAGTNPYTLGDAIYQVGGLNSSGSVSDAVQFYDIGSGTWTSVQSLPHAVHGAASGWLAGRLYVAGGNDTNGFNGTTDLQVFDPSANAWDNTTYPDIPATGGRGGLSGGVGTCQSDKGECLFTVGGSSAGSFVDSTLETWEFDPVTNAWMQLDSRPAGSSPDGFLYGGGVGCKGYIFTGGDYRGYHDFYRLDATQPTGSQWAQMADIPADAGAMSPAMVCAEDDMAIYLIGGDPDGSWGDYNASVYRYDLVFDTWSKPLGAVLNTGVLGSCAANSGGSLWTYGGTQGSFALDPVPHEALEQVDCPACTTFSATISAPPQAELGQTITYTIQIDVSMLQPAIGLTDPLPGGVEFAGGLSTNLGHVWYEPDPVNAVMWDSGYQWQVASPHPPDPSPGALAEAAGSVSLTDLADSVSDDVGEAPVGKAALPAVTPAEPDAPQSWLYDNGPIVTHIGGGADGMAASALQSALGMTTYGLGNQVSTGNRVADDFTITDPLGWQVEQIIFFAYQTGSATDPSPVTGVYYQIWDGPPNDPASSVVFGDLYTNRLVWTQWAPEIYRVLDTDLLNTDRPVFSNIARAGVVLPSGTYWIDWMVDGSLSSGPWAPPITILGQTTTGNALQYTTSAGAWGPAIDSGTSTQQGMPFLIEGTILEPIVITFNATLNAPAYTLIHNQGVVTCGPDSYTAVAHTRVTGTPEIDGDVPLLPLAVEVLPGRSETVDMQICNTGNGVLTYSMGDLPVLSPLSEERMPTVQLPDVLLQPATLPELHAGAGLPQVAPAAPANPQAVLWDQPTDNHTAVISQYFPDFGRGVFSADDFVITHTWQIESIFIDGQMGSSATGELSDSDLLTWCIYADVGSIPLGFPQGGGHFYCLNLLPTDPGLTFDDAADSVAVDLTGLSSPLILPPGKYWLAFYPTLNFGSVGQWFWETSATTHGQLAHLIDPTTLFTSAWLDWSPWTVIFTNIYDAAFRLEGEQVDTPWLSTLPESGAVQAGMCTSVGINFATGSLPPGDYHSNVLLLSNDVDEAWFTAPVTMTVKLYELYLPTVKRP